MSKVIIGLVVSLFLLFSAGSMYGYEHTSSSGKIYAEQYTNLEKKLNNIVKYTACTVKEPIKFKCAFGSYCEGANESSSVAVYTVQWESREGAVCQYGNSSKFVCYAQGGGCRQV